MFIPIFAMKSFIVQFSIDELNFDLDLIPSNSINKILSRSLNPDLKILILQNISVEFDPQLNLIIYA